MMMKQSGDGEQERIREYEKQRSCGEKDRSREFRKRVIGSPGEEVVSLHGALVKNEFNHCEDMKRFLDLI